MFSLSHHAYLIEGEGSLIIPEICKFLEKSGISIQGNPNVCQEVYENFSIEDSRNLKLRQGERGNEGDKKIFILDVKSFGHEAQNALLKVFEEPAAETHFFIITPQAANLLDTVKSRLITIRFEGNKNKNLDEATSFLKMKPAERLEYVKKLVKKYEDEEIHDQFKTEALNLVNGVEFILHQKFNKTEPFIFEELAKCRSYLNDRGASVKMILEHLSLILL